MDLVETKPGVIFSEANLEIKEKSIDLVRERLSEFKSCIIELGSGSGAHLVALADRYPESLCIGFELRFKRTFKTAAKAEAKGQRNLLIFRTDAKHMPQILGSNTVDQIYVNFPDPWDKSRWFKHRLLSERTLPGIHQALKPGGILRYKTDHQGYFDDVLKSLKTSDRFSLLKETKDLYSSPYLESNIPTEFEMLFRSQGLPICFLEAQKN